jgi:hypothetical protein
MASDSTSVEWIVQTPFPPVVRRQRTIAGVLDGDREREGQPAGVPARKALVAALT